MVSPFLRIVVTVLASPPRPSYACVPIYRSCCLSCVDDLGILSRAVEFLVVEKLGFGDINKQLSKIECCLSYAEDPGVMCR